MFIYGGHKFYCESVITVSSRSHLPTARSAVQGGNAQHFFGNIAGDGWVQVQGRDETTDPCPEFEDFYGGYCPYESAAGPTVFAGSQSPDVTGSGRDGLFTKF